MDSSTPQPIDILPQSRQDVGSNGQLPATPINGPPSIKPVTTLSIKSTPIGSTNNVAGILQSRAVTDPAPKPTMTAVIHPITVKTDVTVCVNPGPAAKRLRSD